MSEPRELTKRISGRGDLEPATEIIAPPPVKNYGIDPAVEEEFRLLEHWRAVRKHIWLVAGVCALITMLAAVYMARKADIFEARARVQVNLETAGSAFNKSAPVIISAGGSDPVYFNTQLQILSGPALMRRVVKTLDLEHNQAFLRPQSLQHRSTWQSLARMVGGGGKDTDENKNKAVEPTLLSNSVADDTEQENLAEAKRLQPFVVALLDGLKVEPVKETRLAFKDTRLIDISFTHSDPQLAPKIANAIAGTFVYANLQKRNETNNTAGDFLQKRVAQLQSQIRTDEERLVNYATSHQILSLDASQNTVVERLAGLNRQLLEAENDRKLAEAAFNAARAPGAAEALAAADGKQIADLEAKLAELSQRRAQLLVDDTEEWPEVKEVTQQIQVLEKQLQDTRNRASAIVRTNLETRYHQTKEREDSLRAAFNQQRSETVSQNEAAIQYRIIQQEIETNKSLLDGLLKSSKENDVVLAGTPNNIYIVDYALVPDIPIGPRRMRTIALALVLSLGLGVGLALFLEYLDDSVRSTEDVEKKLRLPALALIPSSAGRARRRLLPGRGSWQLLAGQKHTELLVGADARAPLAEAYRHLRTAVLLSSAGRAPRTLLITSSVPGEGKTTTAVNLALSLAQTGASVLIIDADMRRPRLHSIFDIEKGKGLSTILSSDLSEAEILSLIEQDESSGLYLLAAGFIPPNPAELISSEQMSRLIQTVETTFAHIIIDSPPIASFTDGVLISSMVDGVILVVHGGKSSRSIVRRSKQLLQDVGAKIFGVVVNNLDVRSHDYYYYQQSYYTTNTEGERFASSTRV